MELPLVAVICTHKWSCEEVAKMQRSTEDFKRQSGMSFRKAYDPFDDCSPRRGAGSVSACTCVIVT